MPQSALPVRSSPSPEIVIAPPPPRRKDRPRRRRSNSLAANAGDHLRPETKPCPPPSSDGRRRVRIPAGTRDGRDGLLGNVDSQRCYAAHLNAGTKGRIERLWGVLQDRLTSELRLAQAHDLDSANRVLARFIADYNRRFARTPRDAERAWRPAPKNLERICCFTHQRIVSNDNVVQWDGRRLQIHRQPRRFSFAGAKVQIHQALNGRVSLYYRDSRLVHSNLSGG